MGSAETQVDITSEQEKTADCRLPLLPLRDVVLFPYMVLPVAVGRERSIKALETAAAGDRRIFLATQKNPQVEDPDTDDVFAAGTVGEIVQVFKLPDGSVKTFVQGLWRARVINVNTEAKDFITVDVEPIKKDPDIITPETEALMRQARQAFSQYVQLNGRLPSETANLALGIEEPDKLADVICANLPLKVKEKQQLLEMPVSAERLENLLAVLLREIELLNLEKKIQARVRGQIEKSQKEYVLNEQMKAIQKELRTRDDHAKEMEELKAKIKKAAMSEEADQAAMKELGRLEKMAPYSPEATVARSYLDWMLSLPWSVASEDQLDLDKAEETLDADHHSMKKPKERILEYLAVCALKKDMRGPILCLVGPPGVGKTSLARSIAKALNRNFARITLGGVRDESEIRGHRRTYIGALPGRIIQQMRRAKTKNPVILLDEIDKMGSDWRGDPAAALLEVLDPEQNKNFVDHYLDVGFDLSSVFFIATANTTHTIPVTLLDRLEMIDISGYTLMEKTEIAKKYLVPKQVKEHGVEDRAEVKFSDKALASLIESFTRESGVRQLDREIASVVRKIAKEIAHGGVKGPAKADKGVYDVATAKDVEGYLGVPKFKTEATAPNDVGVATGLAWTQHGGEMLSIEVAKVPGKGELKLTGQLGSTMQESAHAAFTYVKSASKKFKLDLEDLKKYDLHLHVPEGAIPKDGPSAGVAMAVALASLLMDKAPKAKLAMTGEITLKGRVLPVGGIREKLIAAHREGMDLVLVPAANKRDLDELPDEVKKTLKVATVAQMDDVLKAAFR